MEFSVRENWAISKCIAVGPCYYSMFGKNKQCKFFQVW